MSPNQPVNVVPSEARTVYRAMGLLTDTSRLRFVGAVRFLAGATPDSTLAAVGLSLRNSSLTFVPGRGDFVAGYHVELTFQGDSGAGRQVERDETVRVGNVRETLRREESIIFQQFVAVRPGIYTVKVVVRDANSPAVGAAEQVDTVPRFASPSVAEPLPVYEGVGRTQVTRIPQLVLNPRGTLRSGTDSLRFYVEGYRWRRGTRLVARVVAPDTVELWRDTVALAGDTVLGSAQVVIKPGALPLGRATLHVAAVGGDAHAVAPLLVTFSERWAVADFNQMLTLLRYFPRQDLVAKLRTAPREQRAAAWHEFYRESDSGATTPQNEALDQYFRRVEDANQRFQEPSTPGWQTDRGEVFITLGQPDEAFDIAGVAPGVRWEYTHPHLSLVFKDETGGFGLYRLTRESRTDFENALHLMRRTN